MKVILFRDYKEENWHSMDVYADSLTKYLRQTASRNTQIKAYVSFPRLSVFFSHKLKYIRQFFRYCIYPIGAFFQRADVYHITDHAYAHVLNMLPSAKTVVTCHDLTAPYWMMAHLPLTFKKRIKYAVERWRLSYISRAAGIIAVSHATKAHMVRELHISPDAITVIPEGVDPIFSPCRDDQLKIRIRKKYALPEKYVFHIGTTYYNKNIEGLLKIFDSVAKRDKNIFLIKCGDPWTSEQARRIEASKYGKRIIHLGYVSRTDLPALYSMALTLIQPSYAEGFGFTVLEAMSCGCPVVASDIPAHREMMQSSGLYIHPMVGKKDYRAIASFIRDDKLRTHLSLQGIKRSKQFSWKKTALQTANVYARIHKENLQKQ